jgi:hypothetical protein
MIFSYNEFNEIKECLSRFKNIEKIYTNLNNYFNEFIKENYLNRFDH